MANNVRNNEVSCSTFKRAYFRTRDDTIGQGKDAGFVDRLKLIVPDLVITNLVVPIGTFSPGQLISPIEFDIENQGIADVPATPYTVDRVLSQDDTVDGSDFVVDTFDRNDGLESGGVINISRDITVPANVAFAGNYFLIVPVDVGDVIPESDEDNNTVLFGAGDIDISLTIALDVSLELDDPNGGNPPDGDNGNADRVSNLTTSGDGVWFPQGDRELTDESHSTNGGGTMPDDDAAEAPSIGFNESSFLEIEVTGPGVLNFFWKVSSEPTLNFLSLELNGVEDRRISGEEPFTAEVLFIPNGFNVVRWVWTKLSSVETGEDTGWVDEIDVDPVNVPELVITNVEVTVGEYVLDVAEIEASPEQLLGTEFLEITVEAENQGADFPAPGAGFFTVADMEIRLSEDEIYGNSDDILLGEFARVEETFAGGLKIKFLGPIHLGDDLPEGDFFVLAKIDPLENVNEFDETNNTASTAGPDVQITRLPDLELLTLTFDEQKIYFVEDGLFGQGFSGDGLNLDFTIQNDGLDSVEGNIEWDVKVSLRAISKETVQGLADTFNAEGTLPTIDEFDAASTPAIELGTFTESQLLLGRRLAAPTGDTINISNFLFLPHYNRLETSIGENEPVEDYLYWFEIELDVDNEIRESDERNRILFVFSNLITTVPALSPNDAVFEIRENPGSIDSNEWQEIYGVNAGVNPDADGDGMDNVFEYALNRNPLVADGAGKDLLTSFGITEIEVGGNTDNYLSLTFDFVIQSADLTYDVQAADDVMFMTNPSTLVFIDPPYTGSGVGVGSLTGDGGLTSNPLVLAAVDNGYSARVTVRDSVSMSAAPTRFMRVVIEDTDGFGPSFTSIPITMATEAAVYTYNLSAEDDGGGAGLTYAFTTVPAWITTTTDNTDGTAVTSGTPGAGDVGDHSVVIDVDDGTHGATQSFTITVDPIP